MGERNTTIRAREIGYQLRKLREGAGLKQSYVAKRIGLSPASLCRIEDGTKPPTSEEVSAILAVIGVIGPVREALMSIAREVNELGWVQRHSSKLHQRLATLSSLEGRACTITGHQADVVPPHLQTPEYAEALMRTGGALPEQEIKSRVDARLARRHILFRDDPVHLAAFIQEHVLYRVFGSTAVQHRQLNYLLKMMERTNVIIRVVPLSASATMLPIHSFQVLRFPVSPTSVFVGTRTCDLYLEEPGEVASYDETVHNLLNVALDTGESAGLIARLMRKLEEDPDVLPKLGWPRLSKE